MWSGRSVLMFKRNILSLASELKCTPCNQQAEQASHGKRGADMDHKRSPEGVSRSKKGSSGPEKDHICKSGEREEGRRKLPSVTEGGL